MKKDLIERIFDRAQVSISEEKVSKIINNSTRYPYFYTYSRVTMALFYQHNVLGKRVSEGDEYDQYYLIYSTNLDYLVSDDVRMKELSKIAFGDSKKVINFDEFVELAA